MPSGTTFRPTPSSAAGRSITYDDKRGVYYAVADDPARRCAATPSRSTSATGALTNGDVRFESVTTLLLPPVSRTPSTS